MATQVAAIDRRIIGVMLDSNLVAGALTFVAGIPPLQALYVLNELHKASVHMQLLVTVEECGTGVVCNEVDFNAPIGIEANSILHDARCCGSIDTYQLETMPMKVNRVTLAARIIEC